MALNVSALPLQRGLSLRLAAQRPAITSSSLTSRAGIFALLVLAVPFVALANRPLVGDIFWVLAYAQVLVNGGQLPTADPFKFSPHVTQLIDAQWLSQLVYFAPYRALGLEGVMVFNALVCLSIMAIVLHAAWRRSGSLAAAAFAVLLFTVPAFWFITPRAQTLAYVPFAITCWLLLSTRRRLGTLLALGAVEAVWANLHGSFFVGPLLTLIFLTARAIEVVQHGKPHALIVDRTAQFLVGAGLIQAAATLATPFGLDLYRYALSLSAHQIVREKILEWLPTSTNSPDGVQFFSAVACAIVIAARSRHRVGTRDVLLLVVFTVMGLQAFRNLVWFGLICPPLLAPCLANLRVPTTLDKVAAWLRATDRSRSANLRVAVLCAAVVIAMPWTRAVNPLTASEQVQLVDDVYPVAAAEFLATQPYGRHLFADHYWGSYLDWRLYPQYQPFVDPAIESLSYETWMDFSAIQRGHVTWEELVDHYAADTLLLSHEIQPAMIRAVLRSPRWTMVYDDSQAIIFIRAEEAHA